MHYVTDTRLLHGLPPGRHTTTGAMSDSSSILSLLDNVVAAVKVGFSYDGIVSVPETGLEDAGLQPGLAGWMKRRSVRLLLI